MRPPVRRSAQHPRIKQLRRLTGRRGARLEAGRFVIDGPTLVLEAITAGVTIDLVVVPDDERGSAAAAEIDRHLVGAGAATEVVSVDPGVFAGLAGTDHPQPALAVARTVAAKLATVVAAAATTGGLVLVLGGLADPGNVGTLIRSAEATGAVGVVTTSATADPWSPKVVRSAAGSLFRVPVVADVEVGDLVEALAAAAVALVALDHRGAVPLDTADLSGPQAVAVGSEAHGVPVPLLDAASQVVAIPMDGRVESLNAGVSGSIVLFERARRVRASR